jgi:hypothetical protein
MFALVPLGHPCQIYQILNTPRIMAWVTTELLRRTCGPIYVPSPLYFRKTYGSYHTLASSRGKKGGITLPHPPVIWDFRDSGNSLLTPGSSYSKLGTNFDIRSTNITPLALSESMEPNSCPPFTWNKCHVRDTLPIYRPTLGTFYSIPPVLPIPP